jgi:hypothetical protein
MLFQSLVWSADARARPADSISDILKKLKNECDNPKISNDSAWISYCSETELKRIGCIAALKLLGPVAEAQVRQELAAAKGEYREMLVVTLAAFGDNTSIWQAGRLMVKAKLPAVRVCAALELRRRKDKRLIEPFKQALADPFQRMDGRCVMPGMLYPIRNIATDALVGLGIELDEVRKLRKWWEEMGLTLQPRPQKVEPQTEGAPLIPAPALAPVEPPTHHGA